MDYEFLESLCLPLTVKANLDPRLLLLPPPLHLAVPFRIVRPNHPLRTVRQLRMEAGGHGLFDQLRSNKRHNKTRRKTRSISTILLHTCLKMLQRIRRPLITALAKSFGAKSDRTRNGNNLMRNASSLYIYQATIVTYSSFILINRREAKTKRKAVGETGAGYTEHGR